METTSYVNSYEAEGHGNNPDRGWAYNDGTGYGESVGDGESDTHGGGLGCGYREGTGNGAGDGRGFGDGEGIEFGIQGDGYGSYIGDTNGAGECHPDTEENCILFEIGVPEHLHKLFEPLTCNNMIAAQDFVQAATQEQRDAILGMLELRQE